jgi:putative toxin-antitoxin system antitoxin component (TIGR02293 family)
MDYHMAMTRKASMKIVARGTPVPRKAYFESFRKIIATPLDPANTIEAVRKGVAASAVEQAVEYFDVGQKSLLEALRIPVSSFHRKLAKNETLSPGDSEKVVRLGEITRRAEETFGGAKAAKEWLTSDNLALGATPISLIDTEAGAAQIRRVLTGLDYGSVL